LLYVGNLDVCGIFLADMRGLNVVIQSLLTLVSKGIDPLLAVVGEGEHRTGVEKLAFSLGMTSHAR
jgi:hypothetical protein